MKEASLDPRVAATLEYGPILGFVVAYLVFRNDTFVVAGTAYSGFVAVAAVFVPVSVLAIGVLWALTGRITRLQVLVTVMLVLFGALSVWFNDPRLFKMKPTAIYGLLALTLGVGLMRGQSWLKFVLEDSIPLKRKGWMILTKRVTALCAVSAIANELVWRTQSDEVWVLFETIAMPIFVFVFCIAQVGLLIDHVALKGSGKRS